NSEVARQPAVDVVQQGGLADRLRPDERDQRGRSGGAPLRAPAPELASDLPNRGGEAGKALREPWPHPPCGHGSRHPASPAVLRQGTTVGQRFQETLQVSTPQGGERVANQRESTGRACTLV